MQENYSSTKLPTVGTASGTSIPGGIDWSNPSRITADDGSSAEVSYGVPADFGAAITGSDFDFQPLPEQAVIDGISVFIDGSNIGCYGTVALNLTGSDTKAIGALSGTYGSFNDLWGLDVIDPADIANIEVTIETGDVSGGDGFASIDYLNITVYWHIEMPNTETDVPTRIDYQVFSRDGSYLGNLPKVISDLAFPQDISSGGSTIKIVCGKFIDNEITVDPILDDASNPIQTESDLPILARTGSLVVAEGSSEDEVIFKNSNRIRAIVTNRWYPNGKIVFSGQVNRVDFKYGGGDSLVELLVYSDSLDLDNYIARGYPFSYTNDVSYPNQNSTQFIDFYGGGWNTVGQTWVVGAGVTNLGSITLLCWGTADITVSVYDGPNGTLLGSATKSIANGGLTATTFEFPSLIPVTAGEEYFFAVWLPPEGAFTIGTRNTGTYADGTAYSSSYAGGSGGGSFVTTGYDLYFVTAYGTPTTTTTYSSDDPVTDMARGILLDYNARGGYITERDFTATGLSLTYTFNSATILEALRTILEMSPNGYYFNIDLGTAEIDILPTNASPDYTVVRGRHINELKIGMTIEKVKNYLLLSGGDTGGGVNLFRDYPDSESIADYGLRTGSRSDNRVTLDATADAIGESFIEENSDETQETQLVVLDTEMDISLLTNGKTVGFNNFGNFIDNLVLRIARREINYSKGTVTLTLGRLPVTTHAEIQRLNRELLFEQTVANPTAPT